MIKTLNLFSLLMVFLNYAAAGTLSIQNTSINSNLAINFSTQNYEKIKTDSVSNMLVFDNINCPVTLTTSIEGEVSRNNIYASSINSIGVKFSSSLQNESVLTEAPFTQTFQLPSASGSIAVQRATEWFFLERDNSSSLAGFQQIKSSPTLKSVYSGECFDTVTSYTTIQESSNVLFETCSLTAETIDQRIELGQIPKVTLSQGGRSNNIPFTIDLTDCISPEYVNITFNFLSQPNQDHVIATYPSDSNIGIVIVDMTDNPIRAGVPIKFDNIHPGYNSLYFNSYMIGLANPIKAGEIYATVNFTLTFN